MYGPTTSFFFSSTELMWVPVQSFSKAHHYLSIFWPLDVQYLVQTSVYENLNRVSYFLSHFPCLWCIHPYGLHTGVKQLYFSSSQQSFWSLYLLRGFENSPCLS